MKKILLIVGTRPEAIKLAPIYLQLKKRIDVEAVLVSTGQHKEMIEQIFSFFEIKPEVELNLMRPNQTLAQLTSLLIAKLEETILLLKPSTVIVQGDTTTAMAGALVSFYLRIPLAHVEAGLRSNNRLAPFPEEVNRKMVSLVADFHFAPTKLAANNLAEQVEGTIHVVGNPVVDSLLIGLSKVKQFKNVYEQKFAGLIPEEKKIILVTAHRRESFDGGLENIFKAILELSQKYSWVHFLFPVHLNPAVRKWVSSILQNQKGVTLLDPVGYDEMIYLMMNSFLILSDSGGIQEEAPSLDVPILVLRDVTERPEGIEAGCSLLVGTKTENIVLEVEAILNNKDKYQSMQGVANPYGDGKAALRISEILTQNN